MSQTQAQRSTGRGAAAGSHRLAPTAVGRVLTTASQGDSGGGDGDGDGGLSTAAAPGTAGEDRRWRRLGRRLGGPDRGAEGDRGAAPAEDNPAALHQVGAHFVIAPAPEAGGAAGLPPGLATALETLRPDARTVIVLAASPGAATVLLDRLAELARTAVARGAGTLVLAASGLAAAPATGRRPAERLAELAGLPVAAPDGVVTLRADGTLLTSGPKEGPAASWWLCPPTGGARPLGPLWPPPAAAEPPLLPLPAPTAEPVAGPEPEAVLPPLPPTAPGDAVVSRLPGGYWLRTGPGPDGPHPTALDGAAAGQGTLLLVVGRPGAPLPAAGLLARTVRHLLAASPAEPLLSAPWADTASLTRLAAALAEELQCDVRAAVGLPVRTANGYSSRLLDAFGTPAREPWLTEFTASAARRRVVATGWRSAPPGLAPWGPAVFDALPGWQLEAVPAGLWLRPEGPLRDTSPRLSAPDPDRLRLIVGCRREPVPSDVWAGLGEILRALALVGETGPALLVNGEADEVSEGVARFVAQLYDLDWLDREPTGAPPEPAPVPGPEPEPVSEPAPEPEPEAAPAPDPLCEPLPEPVTAAGPGPVALSGTARAFAPDAVRATARPSTAQEQAAFKELLGPHFQRCASRADQVAMRLPALRSAPREDLKTDLAAVFLHHADSGVPVSRAELVEAARRPGPGPLDPFLACLASGLRRLPSHHGAVLLGADPGPEELTHYRPGAELAEPAPIVGLPAHDVELGAAVEFVVWSATGRRTAAFAEAGEPEVVFPPGSRFSVLDLLSASDGRPTRILLRELVHPSAEEAEPAHAVDRDRQTRLRLTAWLARRDLAPADHRPTDRPERYLLTPGVALV